MWLGLRLGLIASLDWNAVVDLTVGLPELGNLHISVVCGWNGKLIENGLRVDNDDDRHVEVLF